MSVYVRSWFWCYACEPCSLILKLHYSIVVPKLSSGKKVFTVVLYTLSNTGVFRIHDHVTCFIFARQNEFEQRYTHQVAWHCRSVLQNLLIVLLLQCHQEHHGFFPLLSFVVTLSCFKDRKQTVHERIWNMLQACLSCNRVISPKYNLTYALSHQAKHKVDCQPGEWIWSL